MIEEEQAGRPSGIDHAFLAKYAEGYEALRTDVEAATWDSLIESSGLSMQQIRAAGAMCVRSRATICCWCTGVTQQPNGVDNVAMIVNLLLIGGYIGRPGAGTCCIRGHSNVRGIDKVGWLFTFTGAAYNLCRLRNLMARA